MTIGWSQFAIDRHKWGTGFSFCELPHSEVAEIVQQNWDHRVPGFGESGLDRKVVVPIPITQAVWLYAPLVKLSPGVPVRTRVTARQAGEDPILETYVEMQDALSLGWHYEVAQKVEIVCYSASALLDNGGNRSTNCDWEIVALLCSDGKVEPMHPLTMARNYLEMPGGTKTEYTARQFAEAIYHHGTKGVKVIAHDH